MRRCCSDYSKSWWHFSNCILAQDALKQPLFGSFKQAENFSGKKQKKKTRENVEKLKRVKIHTKWKRHCRSLVRRNINQSILSNSSGWMTIDRSLWNFLQSSFCPIRNMLWTTRRWKLHCSQTKIKCTHQFRKHRAVEVLVVRLLSCKTIAKLPKLRRCRAERNVN